MNKLILSTVTILFSFLVTAGSAVAAPEKFKFKNNMKIKVNLLKKNILLPKFKILPPGVSCKSFNNAKKRAVLARKQYRARYNYCRTKSYSIAEQRAAGCKLTDTIAQCNRKLIRSCAKRARLRYMHARARLRAAATKLIKQIRLNVRSFGIILR